MGCRPLWVLAFAALWSGCAGHCGPAPDRAHGPCAHAKPGRGQFAFVATTHPPALRFESVCDARLPLQAGPFRYDARRGLLTGRVRLTNRGRASTPPLLAYVDFLSDDRGDWRFRSQVSTLDSLVTANGRRGFLYGRLGRGQSRWARWSFWVPEGRRRVLRGSGWVGAAHRTGLWVELEELAGGTREGRYDARGWAWLHRADGFSGWGELGTGKRRAPHAVRQKLRVPFSGPVRADVRVRPMGKRGAVRARVGSLTGSVGDGGFGGHRMEHLGDGRISRHPSLVLSDSVRGYSRLDALRLWPLSSGAPPDAVPERVISSRTAPQELPRELRRRLAHQPRPPGVGQGTDALAKWRRRVPGLRARLARLLDLPTPEASPPAVRHLGVSYRGPLRVERLHIEGRPGIWASALVYRLQRTRSGAPIRRPAVLHVVGHYGPGKRWKPIRIFDANLARQGYVVLVVDQLSLGERRTGPENHHFLGMLSWLVGSNAARTLYGEVPRFLDYLERRPDVDPARIGMVGSSGGGTATLLTAARDERVRAAAALASVTRCVRPETPTGPTARSRTWCSPRTGCPTACPRPGVFRPTASLRASWPGGTRRRSGVCGSIPSSRWGPRIRRCSRARPRTYGAWWTRPASGAGIAPGSWDRRETPPRPSLCSAGVAPRWPSGCAGPPWTRRPPAGSGSAARTGRFTRGDSRPLGSTCPPPGSRRRRVGARWPCST